MVIFHSYVSLPEGSTSNCIQLCFWPNKMYNTGNGCFLMYFPLLKESGSARSFFRFPSVSRSRKMKKKQTWTRARFPVVAIALSGMAGLWLFLLWLTPRIIYKTLGDWTKLWGKTLQNYAKLFYVLVHIIYHIHIHIHIYTPFIYIYYDYMDIYILYHYTIIIYIHYI
jgi:hypothetical protein